MIDDLRAAMMLLERIKGELPVAVAVTPPLRRLLSERAPEAVVPERCAVVDVHYLGDEGGICCALDVGGPDGKLVHIVSLTHLRLDRGSPLFRDVEAYQRHRVKKLKRQAARGF